MENSKENKKYKIWFFHHYATPPTSTGLARPYYFSKYLIRKGHDPTVFASSYLHYSDKQLINNGSLYIKDNSSGVPFIYVRTHSAKGNGINRVINMFDFAKNLYKVARKEAKINGKPDIIIASSPHPLTMIVGNYLSKRLNVPCICEVRDLWPESLIEYGYVKRNSAFAKILYRGEKWIYKKSDALIFTMAGGPDYIKQRGWTSEIKTDKIYYINNGVELEKFDSSKEENVLNEEILEDENFVNIVYTGSIRKVNDLNFILETAKIIKNDKIRFIIYGDGNEREDLIKKCKKENIDNVYFMGRIDKKYVPYILTKSTFNLLHNKSSNLMKYGSSQNKLFEYLASGKPIIQTFPGKYLILEKYDCGYVLDEQNPNKLAKLIEEISEDKDTCIKKGLNARKASINYDYLNLTDKLLNVIDNLIKRRVRNEQK